VQDRGASIESQLRERGEIGRLLSSAEGYLDEIVVRRGLFRQRRVLPFEAVAAVDRKNRTVLLRIKP